MRILGLTSLALALSGCAFISAADQEARLLEYDGDGDGFIKPGMGGVDEDHPRADCDDSSTDINPDATEICDGIDNNCDGIVDADLGNGAGVDLFADTDGDGFGDPSSPTKGCEGAEGYVTDNTDCDDASADVKPGGAELCNELDDNCDGSVDEGVQIDLYRDVDGDGFGDESDDAEKGCAATDTLSANNEDCDDSEAAVHPDAEEICNEGVDDDCSGAADDDDSGTIDKPNSWPDGDGDGFGDATLAPASLCSPPSNYVFDGSDCDDDAADVNTAATELCDGIDNNCVDGTDEGLLETLWPDLDGDGFGNRDEASAQLCPGAALAGQGDDCDDTVFEVNPDATEVCDGIDNNCDDNTDEGLLETLWPDLDGDGFGDKDEASAQLCPADGLADNGDDCNDTLSESGVEPENIYPGADEVCNTVDDDCDGLVDNDVVSLATWYADADEDNYGINSDTVEQCFKPDGYVSRGGDCNDSNISIHPNADELCSTAGVDDDCDSEVDEPSAADVTTWYADVDDDGYGEISQPLDACTKRDGYVVSNEDCDDDRADTNPNAAETCNSIDDDCDNETDESPTDGTEYFTDADDDSFGDPSTRVITCKNLQPDGTVEDKTDCDDTNGAINPGADELCSTDGVDDEIDEDSAADATTWYADVDGDTFGDANDSVVQCDQPDGYVDENTDCLDSNASVNPGEVEVCDKLDTDCTDGVFETLVPDDFATIQAAIDAESDAGLICVDEGTYNENIDFSGKSLVVESFFGPAGTIIQGTGSGSVVTIANSEDDRTALRGFTVTGGNARRGAGVFVLQADPHLDNLVIEENDFDDDTRSGCGGVAASLINTNARVTSVEARNNSIRCGSVTGAVIQLQSGTPELYNVRITGNVTTAEWDVFENNDATLQSGALGVDGANATVTNLIVANNIAASVRNNAEIQGCAVFASAGTLTLTNASIHKNSCFNDDVVAGSAQLRGIAFVDAGTTVNLLNVDLSDNETLSEGDDAVVVFSDGTTNVNYSNLQSVDSAYGGSKPPVDGDGVNRGSNAIQPRYQSTTGPAESWDFTLRGSSELIDAGDPSIKDPDDSTSDIGAYGGPGAANW